MKRVGGRAGGTSGGGGGVKGVGGWEGLHAEKSIEPNRSTELNTTDPEPTEASTSLAGPRKCIIASS
eukprot:10812952-Alexandrium_andersonii.AAC.1